MLLAIIAIFSGINAQATLLESELVKRMSRAKNKAEISRLQSDFEALKIARGACRIQLRAGAAPLACFESLEREISWGLHPNAAKGRELRVKLENLCEKAAHELKIPREIPSDASVSLKCRAQLAEARRVLIYKERRPDWSGS